MKTIELKCKCGKDFHKPLKEYNRQIKNNPDYNFYCSRHCCGKYININTIKQS